MAVAGFISRLFDLKTTCLIGLGVGLCLGELLVSLSLLEPGGVIGITFRYIPRMKHSASAKSEKACKVSTPDDIKSLFEAQMPAMPEVENRTVDSVDKFQVPKSILSISVLVNKQTK